MAKPKKEEESGVPLSPLRTYPSDLRPPPSHTSLRYPPLPNSTRLRTESVTHGPMGAFKFCNS